MSILRLTLATLIAALAATSVEAASFNCGTARKAAEKAICRSASLSEKDERMALLYFQARNGLDQATRTQLRSEQRRWLRERNDCGSSVGCLHAAYDDRIDELLEWQGD